VWGEGGRSCGRLFVVLFLSYCCVCDLFLLLQLTPTFTLTRTRRSRHLRDVVKCLWEVFVWGFGVLFLSCACVSVSGVLFSVGVCVTC